LVYISGQAGLDRDGNLAGDTLEEQTRAVFDNIEALLASTSTHPAKLVNLRSFVVGPCDLTGFRRVRDEVYGRWFPGGDRPAHTLAFVSGLARPDLLIEMEGAFVAGVIT
jgi:2-iminobutanoate/2-iminopropanoate deaminase